MKTEVAFDKLCDTFQMIKSIVDKAKEDPEKLKQIIAVKNAKTRADKLFSIAPMMKSFKEEIFSIVALWNDKTVEELSEQPFSVTIKQVMDICVDKDIMDFLLSAQGSAQENTEVTDESSTSSEITQEISQGSEEAVQTETNATYEAFANTLPTE